MLIDIILKKYNETLQNMYYDNKSISELLNTSLENLTNYGLITDTFINFNRYDKGVDTLNANLVRVKRNLQYLFTYIQYTYLTYAKIATSTSIKLQHLYDLNLNSLPNRIQNVISLPVKSYIPIKYKATAFIMSGKGTLKTIPGSSPESLHHMDTFYSVESQTTPYTISTTVSSDKLFNLVTIIKYNEDDIIIPDSDSAYELDGIIVTKPTKSLKINIKTNHFITGLYSISTFFVTYTANAHLNFDININKDSKLILNNIIPYNTFVSTKIKKYLDSSTLVNFDTTSSNVIALPLESYSSTSIESDSTHESLITTIGVPNIGKNKFFGISFNRTSNEINLKQTITLPIIFMPDNHVTGCKLDFNANKYTVNLSGTNFSNFFADIDGDNAFYLLDTDGNYHKYTDFSFLTVASISNSSIYITLNQNSTGTEFENLVSLFSTEATLIFGVTYSLVNFDKFITYLDVDTKSNISIDNISGSGEYLFADIFEFTPNTNMFSKLYSGNASNFNYTLPDGIYLLTIMDYAGTFKDNFSSNFKKDDTIKINAFNSDSLKVSDENALDSAPTFNNYIETSNGYKFKSYDTFISNKIKLGLVNLSGEYGDESTSFEIETTTLSNEATNYNIDMTLLSNNEYITPLIGKYTIEDLKK